MRVMKFGGTSVGQPSSLAAACRLVASAAAEGPVTVVVSALAGVTDKLAEAVAQAPFSPPEANRLVRTLLRRHQGFLDRRGFPWTCRWAEREIHRHLQELAGLLVRFVPGAPDAPARHDRVLALGERMAAPLFAAALRERGVRAEVVDAAKLLVTDGRFGRARVELAATRAQVRRRLGALPPGVVAVVPGFFGVDRDGRTTLLGRGGSDTTAAVLGAALGAQRVEIWTDVAGICAAPSLIQPEVLGPAALPLDHALVAEPVELRELVSA